MPRSCDATQAMAAPYGVFGKAPQPTSLSSAEHIFLQHHKIRRSTYKSVEMATEATVRKFFASSAYAVAGASSNPAKFGHRGKTYLFLRIWNHISLIMTSCSLCLVPSS